MESQECRMCGRSPATLHQKENRNGEMMYFCTDRCLSNYENTAIFYGFAGAFVLFLLVILVRAGFAVFIIMLGVIGFVGFVVYTAIKANEVTSKKKDAHNSLDLNDPNVVLSNFARTNPVEEETEIVNTKTADAFEIDDDEFIRIASLKMKVRACCYQAARLNERICVCGRVVPDEVNNLFN